MLGHKDVTETDSVDEHVAQLFLFDFEQSGIHLEQEKRARVVYLNDLILYTGQKFMANAMKPSSIAKDSVPESVRP